MGNEQSVNQLTMFDYSQLDIESSVIVQQRTGEIKALMKRTAQDIIEIGEKLIEVKKRLPHGVFGGWLDSEFQWSNRTAQKYISIAVAFSNTKNSSGLTMSFETMAYLAAPSTPDEARQEAITQATNGKTITHQAAKNIVSRHKTQPDSPINTCQECGQMYDNTTFQNCPYCYKKRHNLRPGFIDHLPELVNKNVDLTYGNKSGDTPKVFSNRQTHTPEPTGRDYCQSPSYAILPILPYLPPDKTIWEPARGEGLLETAMLTNGLSVVSSCILTGQDFFSYEPNSWDILVTNPPWSLAEKWIARCFELGKPFALLLKTGIATNSGIQKLNAQYGDFQMIYPESRINYKMPLQGWEADGAPFNTHWYTFGLEIGKPFTYLAPINEEKRNFHGLHKGL